MQTVNTVAAKQQGKAVAVKNQKVRAQRIAAVQAVYVALGKAAQASKRAVQQIAIQQAKQQAYMLAVQQLAAQYGVAPITQQVRSVAGAQKHAPSAAPGACKVVHELAAANNYDRKATLAACALAGINPATAATQFAIAKRKAVQ